MDSPRISRRTILATVGAAGTGTIAGCSGGNDDREGTATRDDPEGTTTQTDPGGEDTEEDPTETDRQDGTTIYVDPEGSDDDPGTSEAPVATIFEAVDRVQPGETVYVNPGEYQESFPVQEGGTPEEPIEITGPPDAVLRRDPDEEVAVAIAASHVHLTGLTITGLVDPDAPEDPAAYNDGPLVTTTPTSLGEYVEDVVVAPHALGHSGRQLVKLRLTRDAEVGPFRVDGPAGAKWLYSDENDHNGELVYVGTSPNTIAKVDEWTEWDRTRNVHVHHVDNAAGHAHSQLVDVKPGAENVTIEYCTDGGGSQNAEDFSARSVALRGYRCTLRWCRLQDGEGHGVGVGSVPATEPENEVQERAGDENEIYGNEIFEFDQHAIIFPHADGGSGQGPGDQAVLCGNRVDDPAEGDPAADCSGDVPTGDAVGHVGGDSPWTGESLRDPPEFTVDATIRDETVTVGDRVTVLVTVSNVGGSDGTLTLTVSARDTELASERVSVPAGEDAQTEIVLPPAPEPGTVTLSLNGEDIGDVTIEPDDDE